MDRNEIEKDGRYQLGNEVVVVVSEVPLRVRWEGDAGTFAAKPEELWPIGQQAFGHCHGR